MIFADRLMISLVSEFHSFGEEAESDQSYRAVFDRGTDKEPYVALWFSGTGFSKSEMYLSIYLSIFLYVLTPEGDIRRVPVNQVLGVSFFVCVCNVSCVSSEWEKPVLALWCWAPNKVATGTIFNAFGMARPGFEPATSRSRSGRSTTWAIAV